VLRVFGGGLRKVLSDSVSNRFHAFLAGLGVTALVQSSSATALITSSFVAQNLIGLAPALAIMLGADVGTSLVVQLFSFDLSWLSPLAIGGGVILHLSRKATRIGQIGRISIGIGLIILALQMILQATRPAHRGRRGQGDLRHADRRPDARPAGRRALQRRDLVEPRGGAAHRGVRRRMA
jgi:phosphate:Na+ symporter